MKPVTLTKSQSRQIILHAAGLSKRGQFGKGIEAAFKVIDQLGFIQVDTNYVVERAHHHALFSRVPDYKTEWLEELQTDGRIYEFWTRDSGFMPVSDYRFSLPVQKSYAARWKDIPQPESNLMQKILDRIGREGPLGAKDFDNDRVAKSSGWWDWRPSKVALERLHLSGQLLTTRKKDFHKLYDLTGNIISGDTDKSMPADEEFARHLILRSLQALGIASVKEIAWNGRFVKPDLKTELNKMVESGEILLVQIEAMKGPMYMLPGYKNKKIGINGDVFILSPFDILNVFRHRLRDFFNFDYQVECFVPQPKRKYGYFSLPVLTGDTFVARMDSKADRKTQTLIVHNMHFENLEVDKVRIEKIRDAIRDFAAFNSCNEIRVAKSNNNAFMKAIG